MLKTFWNLKVLPAGGGGRMGGAGERLSHAPSFTGSHFAHSLPSLFPSVHFNVGLYLGWKKERKVLKEKLASV